MRALGASRTSLVSGGVLGAPWVRDPLWRNARAVPTLDLRFADNKSLTDAVTGANLVTFTRASSGTFVDSAGVIQTASTDVPRFDHNPTTLESLGLLVEEQRTNSITNNTMVGAVAGTPGTNPTGWPFVAADVGLTQEIIGVGTESGISYIDYRFSGTTTTTTGILIAPGNGVALTGQTWNASTYWKLAGGSNTGIFLFAIGIIEETLLGVFVTGAFYGQTAPTSGPLISQRPTATRTLSGGATVGQVRHTIQLGIPTATAIDITLRIGLPQLEQGAFATSPILTSTAAVTRSADVASITGSAFSSWYRQDEGTVFCAGVSMSSAPGPMLVLRDATAANRHQTGINNAAIVVSSAVQASFGFAIAGQARCSFGYALNNSAFVTNLNAIATDINCLMPSGVTYATIGKFDFGGGESHNGTIRRLTFWPQRLPNSTLQSITQ
jgi:hypothetical protein